MGLLLSLSLTMCVRFTSKGGAKGNSDGQLVCNTLHGVVWQSGQCVQLLPGVGWCGNTFLWAAEEHDVAANIQWALDSTCWYRWGHWQMERVGDVALSILQSKSNILPTAEEISHPKKSFKISLVLKCWLPYRKLLKISDIKDSFGSFQTEKNRISTPCNLS